MARHLRPFLPGPIAGYGGAWALLATLWHPAGTAGIVDAALPVAAGGGFVALLPGKIPPWAVVIAAAGAGTVWF